MWSLMPIFFNFHPKCIISFFFFTVQSLQFSAVLPVNNHTASCCYIGNICLPAGELSLTVIPTRPD